MPEQRCRCRGGRRPDVTRSAGVCVWIMALSYQSYVFSSPRNANASTVTGFLQFRTGGKELTLVGIRYSSGWRAPENGASRSVGSRRESKDATHVLHTIVRSTLGSDSFTALGGASQRLGRNTYLPSLSSHTNATVGSS